MLGQKIHCSRRILTACRRVPATSSRHFTILKRPSFNFKEIIADEDNIVKSAKRRATNEIEFDSLKTVYVECCELKRKLDSLRAERNRISSIVKKEKKNAPKDVMDRLSELKVDLKATEEKHKVQEAMIYAIASKLPNYIDESVRDEEELIEILNSPAEPIVEKENPVFDHKKIGVELGILDFESAARVSGNSWYYLVGDGALLEQALVAYALKLARQKGFKMMNPPSIVKTEVIGACGFQPRDKSNEQQLYELKEEGLCLTGTAEIPLAAFHINKTFSQAELPVKYVGVSRSYRAEAGARGKDTKGLYRVHEFTKVELFMWTDTIESAKTELNKLNEFQKEIVSSLGLTARVLNMPANDLGAPAYKKYDIEAWMPGRGSWGEVTSASNCTDYQSRRMNTKFENENGEVMFAQTLNGTAMAVPRIIAAIIENNYDPKTKTVSIPEVLRSYMDGKDKIVKQ